MEAAPSEGLTATIHAYKRSLLARRPELGSILLANGAEGERYETGLK
jgi:hypothetical protein